MASFGIIQDVNIELHCQVFSALNATPDTDFSLEGEIERITLQAPDDKLADAVAASH